MFVLNICIIIAKLTVYVAGSCHFLLPLLTLCSSSLCALEHPARSPARVLLAHWSQRAMLLATRGSAVLHSASRDRQNERQADVTLHFLLFDCKRDELLCTGYRPTSESQLHSCTLCNGQFPYHSNLLQHIQSEKHREFEASLDMCYESTFTSVTLLHVRMHSCPLSFMQDCLKFFST